MVAAYRLSGCPAKRWVVFEEMELGKILGKTIRNPRHHFGAIFRRVAVEADATESGRLTLSPVNRVTGQVTYSTHAVAQKATMQSPPTAAQTRALPLKGTASAEAASPAKGMK